MSSLAQNDTQNKAEDYISGAHREGDFVPFFFRIKKILGVPVTSVGVAEAGDILDRALDLSHPTPVAFMNANTAVCVHENQRMREVLKKFIVFNDGIGMDIGCFLKYGTRFSCNLNGTDFIPTFLENTRHKLRIFLLGSRGNVVKEAARVLALRFPAHRIVGFHDGYFPEERSAEIAEKIRRANANVLLVAMGNCMQELWIADNLERTGATLALGVGALFDFISKRVPRAPRLVRASCLEWLWRLMLEPRRLWRRYTIRSVLFLFYASKDALAYQWREVRCRLWGSLDFTAAMASVDRKKAIGKAFNRKPGTI